MKKYIPFVLLAALVGIIFGRLFAFGRYEEAFGVLLIFALVATFFVLISFISGENEG